MYDLPIGDLLHVKNDGDEYIKKMNNLDNEFDGTKEYKMTIKDRN